jgi:hypothetical protein
MIARLQAAFGRLLAKKRFRQFQGEQPFTHTGRSGEEIRMRQPAAMHGSAKSFHQGVMPANALPCQGSPSFSGFRISD